MITTRPRLPIDLLRPPARAERVDPNKSFGESGAQRGLATPSDMLRTFWSTMWRRSGCCGGECGGQLEDAGHWSEPIPGRYHTPHTPHVLDIPRSPVNDLRCRFSLPTLQPSGFYMRRRRRSSQKCGIRCSHSLARLARPKVFPSPT